MQNPDNLRVSRDAEDLADRIYDFTAAFPRDERFGLTAQMRRAAVSIGSNIFEGCSRQSNKSLVAYLYHAHGSAGELVFQMIGAVAQFERSLIGERVKSGLANARAKGKLLGRPPLRKLTAGEMREVKRQRSQHKVPFRILADKFGISVWSAHRLCRRAR